VSLCSLPASAVEPAQREEAHRLFVQGSSHFERGDMPGAEGLFKRAYRLDPIPGNLWRWARSIEEQGRSGEALALFRELAERHPGSRYGPLAQEKVTLLTPAPPATQPSVADDGGDAGRPRRQAPEDAPQVHGAQKEQPEDAGARGDPASDKGRRPRRARANGWVVGLLVAAGVGGAAAGAGLAVTRRAEREADSASLAEDLADHNGWVRVGNGLQVGGLGLAAGGALGAALIWWMRGAAPPATASVYPAPGGVQIAGRF